MIYAPRVKLQELAPGLWRWTAPHPDWQPPKSPDSPADCEPVLQKARQAVERAVAQ
jgi:hypothetical protein